jgi:probable selenium-dependent hydroxylase accessory protein YqeC
MSELVLLSQIPIRKGDIVSIVGSGGKTTLMYTLARELVERGNRVVTTTTTKIFTPRPTDSPQLLVSDKEEYLLERIQELLRKARHVTAAEKSLGPKLKGLSPTVIDRIREQGSADVIIVEADGAKRCPLKAPNETEPVIPSSTTLTLPVVGLDGIGQPNTEDYVFRPHHFSLLTGISEGDVVTPESVARAILHPGGLTKGTPEKAQIVVILNKGEIDKGLDLGEEVAQFIADAKKQSIKKVLITSLIPRTEVMTAFSLD